MSAKAAREALELPKPPKEAPFPEGVLAVAYADGASRGNPGPASFGCAYTLEDGTALCGEGEVLEETTNNVAEYQGCIRALERMAGWGLQRVELRLDSELVVRQIEGRYRVRQEHLKPLRQRARELADGFASFSIVHVPRKQNALADALANAALDGTR